MAAVVVRGGSKAGGDRFGMGWQLMGMMSDGCWKQTFVESAKVSDAGLLSIRLNWLQPSVSIHPLGDDRDRSHIKRT